MLHQAGLVIPPFTWAAAKAPVGPRVKHVVGFGEINSALNGAPGGGLVAEGVPRDRLQQEFFHQPDQSAWRGGVGDEGCGENVAARGSPPATRWPQ